MGDTVKTPLELSDTVPLYEFTKKFFSEIAVIDRSDGYSIRNYAPQANFDDNYNFNIALDIRDNVVPPPNIMDNSPAQALVSDAMPRSKQHREIYRMIYSHKMRGLDLGSGQYFSKGLYGNLRRLGIHKYYTGPNYIVVDKNLNECVKGENIMGYRLDFGDDKFRDLFLNNTDRLLTSVNALMHMPPSLTHHILQLDGMHTIPDHEAMISGGTATDIDEFTYESRYGNRKNIENKILCSKDYPFDRMQAVIVTHKQRYISVKLIKDKLVDEPIEEISKPRRLELVSASEFSPPFSKKIDGITGVLELKDGILELTTPIRLVKWRAVGDVDINFKLECEVVGDTIIPHYLVRSHTLFIFPLPHALKNFLDSTKIKFPGNFQMVAKRYYHDINDCLTDEEPFPYDGVVSMRHNVAGKPQETIDIDTSDLHYMDQLSINVLERATKFDYFKQPGICEYLVRHRDGEIDLEYMRDRPDKRSPNTIRRATTVCCSYFDPKIQHLTSMMDLESLKLFGIHKKET